MDHSASSPQHRFVRYEMRTNDPAKSLLFYQSLFSPTGDAAQPLSDDLSVTLMPERARLSGAPAHWLGYLQVNDVAQKAQSLIARGCTVLGPPLSPTTTSAVFRDLQGALFAIESTERAPAPQSSVGWHQLHTKNAASALDLYHSAFNWAAGDEWDGWGEAGPFHGFSWSEGEPMAGAIIAAAQIPGVHVHWTYYFSVPDLRASCERVAALGGRVVQGPLDFVQGYSVAYCEDDQRGAFGLASKTQKLPKLA